jgi:hypothetical protein
VWRLSGFAADPVVKLGVIGTDGKLYDVTPVAQNVYQASNLPAVTPRAIVGFDSANNQIYEKCVVRYGC